MLSEQYKVMICSNATLSALCCISEEVCDERNWEFISAVGALGENWHVMCKHVDLMLPGRTAAELPGVTGGRSTAGGVG